MGSLLLVLSVPLIVLITALGMLLVVSWFEEKTGINGLFLNLIVIIVFVWWLMNKFC